MIEVKLTTEEAKSLEQFVEDHMYLCQAELMGEDVPEEWSPYSVYDGCPTCDSREYLMATFDWLNVNKSVNVFVEDTHVDESQTLF
jgi:hypothetical protein